MMDVDARTHRIAERILTAFARNLPSDLQPWGDAILAEIPVVKGTISPLIWALGGSMFLSKTLVVRWFSGERIRGPQFREDQSLSPLQKVAVLAVALSFAMLLSPMFRQAMQTSLTAWTSENHSADLPDMQRVITEATRTGNAPLLAAAAMHVRDHRKAIDLAGKATQLDPQLTWIWYVMIGRFSYDLPEHERDRFVEEKSAVLQAWDPSNTIPWILDAHRVRTQQGGIFAAPNSVSVISENSGQLSPLKEWQSLMAKAIAAPRYDDYFEQRMTLERMLQKQLGASKPFAVVDTIENFPGPELQEARLFTSYKLLEGDQSLAQGQTDHAIAMYEEPEHFAQRLQSQSRQQLVEKLYTDNMLNDSEKKLAAAFKLTHREVEADQLLKQIAVRNSQKPDFMSPGKSWEIVYGPVTAGGMAVSVASVCVMMSLAFIVIGFGYFFTTRSLAADSTTARAPRWLDRTLIAGALYSPLLLLASCLSLYFAYRPFGTIFGRYLSGGLPSSETDSLRMFWQVRYVPNLVILALGGSEYLELWACLALVVLLLIPLAIIIWRSTPSRKTNPVS